MAFVVLRLILITLVICGIIYVFLWLYSRSARRAKLNEWFDEAMAEDPSVSPADRDNYIRKGLEEYDNSLRPKLLLGVFVVPFLLVALIIYFTNFA